MGKCSTCDLANAISSLGCTMPPGHWIEALFAVRYSEYAVAMNVAAAVY